MIKKAKKIAAVLLGIAVLCTAFTAGATAFADGAPDIPSGYVVFDGTHYYVIQYDDLLDSYISFLESPDSGEAKLAKFYFDTLGLGFETHFIAYVSAVTNKYVAFDAILDKFIETEDILETYNWFNSNTAAPAFGALTEVKTLGPDAGVTGSVFVGADGYEAAILIDNPSVEVADSSNPAMPENWSYNSWGSHTAAFTYLNEGQAGSRSVMVEVSGYANGDAKWFFDPIPLAPGDYMFSDYYRCDVDTRVIAAVATGAGEIKYIDLPMAPASEEWTKYEVSFTMPSDGETVTIYHLLSDNGCLITDNYQISYYHYEGFDRGLLTITFDDGWEDNPQTALPIMQQYGFKSNQYYATTYIENPRVDDPKTFIGQFIDDGHEIGSHSITHADLTTLSAQDLIHELEGSKQFLEDYLEISIDHFATPYGAYNTAVNREIMNHYDTHRTVDIGYNSKDNFDVRVLKSMSILPATTADEVKAWARKAKEEKLWLILLYHRVADDPNPYDTTPALFAAQMQAIDDVGIPVVTVSEAVAEIESQ